MDANMPWSTVGDSARGLARFRFESSEPCLSRCRRQSIRHVALLRAKLSHAAHHRVRTHVGVCPYKQDRRAQDGHESDDCLAHDGGVRDTPFHSVLPRALRGVRSGPTTCPGRLGGGSSGTSGTTRRTWGRRAAPPWGRRRSACRGPARTTTVTSVCCGTSERE